LKELGFVYFWQGEKNSFSELGKTLRPISIPLENENIDVIDNHP
jgi:hypothetical protein